MIGAGADPTALRALADRLPVLARRHRVPGGQLVLHRGGWTVATAFGEREYGTGHLVNRETAVPIGSITKSFTATLAMILVADGEMELDVPVGDYLPELRDRDVRLTLRHLLSHTGGLTSGPDSTDIAAASIQRYVLNHCHRQNVMLVPGARFSYSNLGYVLVGRLVEAMTGMSWWEAMESILLRPLGVAPTFVVTPEPAGSDRPMAAGHSVNLELGCTRPVLQSIVAAEAPTGALAVSASDLIALGRTCIGQGPSGLLSRNHAATMRQPVPSADPFGLADGWGLGLAVFRQGATHWVGHDGNADGTSCYLRADPSSGWVVALTTNSNSGVGLWQDLLPELGRAGLPIGRSQARVPADRPASPPPDCAGTYANGDVEYVVAANDEGQLCLAVDGDPFAPLTCYGDLVFALHDPASGRQVLGGRFVRDPDTGSVDGIQVGGRLARALAHTPSRR